jgi:hypothetical protein
VSRSVKVTLEADPAKFTTGIEPCKRSVEDFKGTLNRLDATIKTLPDIKVHAETTDAELKLAAIKEELKDLRDRGTTVDVHLAAAQVARLRAELAALTSGPGTSLAMHLTVAQAGAELEKLAKTLPPVMAKVGEQSSVSLFSRFTAGAEKFGKSISGDFEMAFEDGLLGVLKSPAGIGAVAVVAVEAGTAIGGALLTGIGLAGIGAGIAGQIHDRHVQAALTQLKTDVSTGFKDSTSAFADPLRQAINDLDRHWLALQPGMKATFTELAPLVGELERGAAGFGDAVIPALERAAVAAKPLVQDFAQWLPGFGNTVASLFDTISAHSGEALHGLRMIEDGLTTLVVISRDAIPVVSKLSEALAWTSPLKWTEAWFGSGVMDSAHKSMAGFARSIYDVANAATTGSTQINGLAVSVSLVKSSVDNVLNGMLGLDRANLSVAESLTKVTDSIRMNGSALDIHSKSGQANRDAILAAVGANVQAYDAMIQSGVGAQDAARAYDQNTAALERQLRQAGLTQAQIDDLIGRYRNVPDKVNTAIATLGLTDAINNLADLLRLINHIPSYKSVTIDTKFTSSGPAAGYTWMNPGSWGHGMASGGAMIPAANGLAYGAGIYPASNPPLIKFAEPITRGETLIPNFGIPAARGLALADYAASHYGGRVVGGDGAQLVATLGVAGGADGGVATLIRYLCRTGLLTIDARWVQ